MVGCSGGLPFAWPFVAVAAGEQGCPLRPYCSGGGAGVPLTVAAGEQGCPLRPYCSGGGAGVPLTAAAGEQGLLPFAWPFNQQRLENGHATPPRMHLGSEHS